MILSNEPGYYKTGRIWHPHREPGAGGTARDCRARKGAMLGFETLTFAPIDRRAGRNYYCKKPDGTTGLIVGGIAGGVLGNIIAPGGSKTLGTILGAGVGAIAGNAIDKKNIRCR
jgi:hypothetical protein